MQPTLVSYPDDDNKPNERVDDLLYTILNTPSTIFIGKLKIDVTCIHLYIFLTAKVQVRKLTVSHLPTKYVTSFNEWLSHTESLETLKIKVCDEDMILDSIKNGIKGNRHLGKLTISIGRDAKDDREALEIHLLDTLSCSKIAHLKLDSWEFRNTLIDPRIIFKHLRSFSMIGCTVSLDTNLGTVTLPHLVTKCAPNLHTVLVRHVYMTPTVFWNTLSPLAYNDNMETISVGGCDLTQRVGMLLLTLIMLKRDIQLKFISSENTYGYLDTGLPSELNAEINKFRADIQGDPLLTGEYWNTMNDKQPTHDVFMELLEQVQSNCSLRHFHCLVREDWLNETPYADILHEVNTIHDDETQVALKRSKLSNEAFVREIKKNLGIVDLYSMLPIAHGSRKRGSIDELPVLKPKKIKL